MTSWSFLPPESSSLPTLPAQCSDYLFIRLKLNSSLHIGYAELGHTHLQLLHFWHQQPLGIFSRHYSTIFMNSCSGHWSNEQSPLTSSSLYQDRDSAVKMNQYSFDPPFMMLMLIVSQPFLITCTVTKKWRRDKKLNIHRKEADGWRDMDMAFTIRVTFIWNLTHLLSLRMQCKRF